ncbi:hypothetical protein [Saccharothrix hoggarensis]
MASRAAVKPLVPAVVARTYKPTPAASNSALATISRTWVKLRQAVRPATDQRWLAPAWQSQMIRPDGEASEPPTATAAR